MSIGNYRCWHTPDSQTKLLVQGRNTTPSNEFIENVLCDPNIVFEWRQSTIDDGRRIYGHSDELRVLLIFDSEKKSAVAALREIEDVLPIALVGTIVVFSLADVDDVPSEVMSSFATLCTEGLEVGERPRAESDWQVMELLELAQSYITALIQDDDKPVFVPEDSVNRALFYWIVAEKLWRSETIKNFASLSFNTLSPKIRELAEISRMLCPGLVRDAFKVSDFEADMLRVWALGPFLIPPEEMGTIAIIGRNPLKQGELYEILEAHDYDVMRVDERPTWMLRNVEVAVVGREGWTEGQLIDLINQRAEQTLRVYSQEMFLLFLNTGIDPFEFAELLEKFGNEHPALECLMNLGFEWPTTLVTGIGGLAGITDWRQLGLLKYMEYTVGENGLARSYRRKVLREVFTEELPATLPKHYQREWGRPNSPHRLEKMANSIALFCRLYKGKYRSKWISSHKAVTDWESDLGWLRRTFYDPNPAFHFEWPNTKIG